MAAKKTLIALAPKGSKATEFFEIEHAERILRLHNCAWEVVDDNLEWTGNEFVKKPNTSRVKSVEQKTAD